MKLQRLSLIFLCVLGIISTADLIGSKKVKRFYQRPIKFKLIYGGRFEAYPHARKLKRNVIEPIIKYLESTIQARSHKRARLLVRRTCNNSDAVTIDNYHQFCPTTCIKCLRCKNNVIPQMYMSGCSEGEMNNTRFRKGKGSKWNEFILLVDISNDDFCPPSTISYIEICARDPHTDRNFLAELNLCIGNNTDIVREVLQNSIKYEIISAMGFNYYDFAFLLDEDGHPRTRRDSHTGLPLNFDQYKHFTPSENTIGYVYRPRGFRKAIKLPMMLQMWRSHTNCSNLDGLELANEGNVNLDPSIFGNELMTGIPGLNKPISILTLAFLEDTGWYKVDYSKAEAWSYAQNAGCSIVYDKDDF